MTDMDRRPDEDELFSSLNGLRFRDALLGEDSGRGALGDLFADSMLARDIADGRDVRDALMSQRFWDGMAGADRSRGFFADMASDDMIARDFENGEDLGTTIERQRFWDDLFD